MQTLRDFFERDFLRSLADRDRRTIAGYQQTVKLVVDVLDDPTPGTLGFSRDAFIRELRKRQLATATINKHIRHVNAVLKQMGPGVPAKYTGVPAK